MAKHVKNGHDMAIEMANFVNNCCFKPKDFVETFSKEHRTLQQTFTGLCLAWLQKLAEMEKAGYYDGRNEASVKIARKIMDNVEEANWPSLPYV